MSLGQARLSTLRKRLPIDVLRKLPDELPASKGKVAVIGAGFAGLATAHFLRFLGFEVTVFEAAERTGGRVETVHAPGTNERLVEAGAELIGYNHAVWLAFAEIFQLNFSIMTPDEAVDQLGLGTPMWLNNRRVGDPAKVWAEVEKALDGLNADAATILQPYRPWTAPRASEWDDDTVGAWIARLTDISDDGRLALRTLLGCDQTISVDQQSLLGLLAQVSGGGLSAFWSDTEVMRCSSGNQSLSNELTVALENHGVNVYRNAAVKTVTPKLGAMTVEAAGHGSADFAYVVLAVPPTVWSRIIFGKPIDLAPLRMSTGDAVKFLSTCRRRFWLQSRLAPNALSDVIGETWEATDNQTWVGGQHVVLSVFGGAEQAKNAIDHRPDPSAWYVQHMEKLFPGFGSALAAAPLFMDWPAHEWIGCGYSCPAKGYVTTRAKLLAEAYAPVDGRLVFAGEHVCPPFFGFMEGALESGLLAMGHVAGKAGGLFSYDDVVNALDAAAMAGRGPV